MNTSSQKLFGLSKTLLIGSTLLMISFFTAITFWPSTTDNPLRPESRRYFIKTAYDHLFIPPQFSIIRFEGVFNQWAETPHNKQATEHYDQQKNKIDQQLASIVDIYGLRVRRAVNIFQIWRAQAENKLLKATSPERMAQKLNYLVFSSNVSNTTDDDLNSFEHKYFNEVVDDTYQSPLYPIDQKLVTKLLSLYDSQPELVAQYSEQYQWPSKSMSNCLTVYLDNLDNTDQTIQTLVKQVKLTRYCPILAKNKYLTSLFELRLRPVFSERTNSFIKINLAVAVAAQKIQSRLKTQADQKYAKLSFDQYYRQYVKPQIPQVKPLLAHIGNRTICFQNFIPVVGWRDPKVDAYTAAVVEQCDNVEQIKELSSIS